MNPQPEPIKRSMAKRKKTAVKNANISDVRDQVEKRDGEACRITTLLRRFGFHHQVIAGGRLELAHVAARGMGGNPDLSRDTPENTLLALYSLHNGGKYSMHGEMIDVVALTDRGADGPIAVTFYEVSPKAAK